MQKLIVSFGLIGLMLAVPVFAQMGPEMGQFGESGTIADDHTKEEEAKGKVVWEKFQAKQVDCDGLTDEDFGVLGEYFMGKMLGDAHPAMNAMMIQIAGEDGEEAMHIVMGKRFSECVPSAAYPAGGIGFMPMMNMMMGGWSTPLNGFNTQMMGYGFSGYGFGFLWMIFWWVLVIALIIFLVRWAMRQVKGEGGRSAVEILKERYAKGEIDRKEFEERMKDLKNA